jgi:hypothetical protein
MSVHLESQQVIRHIGIDLDNTIIDYTKSFIEIGRDFGFKPNSTRESIRKALRRTDGTDDLWQEFQSLLYTRGLDFAELAPSAKTFMSLARKKGIEVSIVSHKSRTTQERFGGQDLRGPALDWLRKHQLIPQIVDEKALHFTSTQEKKIKKIIELRIDFFIDDLEEVIQKLVETASLKTWHFSLKSKQNESGDFQDLLDKFGFDHAS